MTTIVGLSGSLRKSSFNGGLLRAAAELAPADCKIEIASIRGIPLYDGDVEAADGLPGAVVALKDKIAAADALLLATPEYNNSMSGVLKNATDWLSRPGADRRQVFSGKPVGLIGASPGRFGTLSGQTAWLPVFRTLSLKPWFGALLYVGGAGSLFDGEGNLTDAETRDRVAKYMAGFAAFVADQG